MEILTEELVGNHDNSRNSRGLPGGIDTRCVWVLCFMAYVLCTAAPSWINEALFLQSSILNIKQFTVSHNFCKFKASLAGKTNGNPPEKQLIDPMGFRLWDFGSQNQGPDNLPGCMHGPWEGTCTVNISCILGNTLSSFSFSTWLVIREISLAMGAGGLKNWANYPPSFHRSPR